MISNLFKYGIEELKFVRSFKEVKILINRKIPFLLKRIAYNYNVIGYSKIPTILQIEPTNICNLDCICCGPRRKMKREKGFIELNFFKEIINEASEIGVKKIHLYTVGEPLLHPKIVDLITYIKSKGLCFTMATNGMLLSRNKTEGILNADLDSSDTIIFSVLGYSKDVHEEIMRGANHDKILKNIHNFIKERKKNKMNGPVIKIDFYKMKENENEVEQFFKYWKGTVDHVKINNPNSLFAGFDIRGLPLKKDKKRKCRLLWERLAVNWDGNVPLCVNDIEENHILGSLKDDTIQEIWNGSKTNNIRNKHKEWNFDKLSLCSSCDELKSEYRG